MPFGTKVTTTVTTTAANGTKTVSTKTVTSQKPFDITLYLAGTPNGKKASIALEELAHKYGVTYKVRTIDFSKNEQKDEWFLKINPNGRIPAIVDHGRGDFAVFESGAILLYLAEHYDPDHVLLSADENERSTQVQWLMWQMGGLGPMMGQAGHFKNAPETIPYAIKRYRDETVRLMGVIERGLSDQRLFLGGSSFSVADIASFPWAGSYQAVLGSDASWDEFPLTYQWLVRVSERPGVRAGMDVPSKSVLIENKFLAAK